MEYEDMIPIYRDKLMTYFVEKSKEIGLDINPTIRNPKDTMLAGRLYEEASVQRQFIVYPTKRPESVEHFEKKTGVDDQVMLLAVMSPLNEVEFPEVWRLYINWRNLEGTMS
ncbi:MAG: hypothetical protein JF570_05195 [Caulobacter sp.]|nr:hypothetical protein [Caulobacter sp.]MBW8892214.1 hypothetical protein [Burkholderiales bacterium]